MAADWRRPSVYLDAGVRAGISSLAQLGDAVTARGVQQLRADLESGAWQQRNEDVLALDEYDGGYRLVIAGPPSHSV